MIPLFADLRIETQHRRLRLFLPLFLIWLILLPLVLVLLPFAAIACVILRINPFSAIGTLFSVLTAIPGTQLGVERPGSSIFIHIV